MFRHSMCLVLLLALVHIGWGLKCYQCDEQKIFPTPTIDLSCKGPTKDAHTQDCKANEMCIKHNSAYAKDYPKEQRVSRFCGTKDTCKLKDKELLQELRQIMSFIEPLMKSGQKLQPEQEQNWKMAQDMVKQIANSTGECNECGKDLCNSASTVFPSFIVSSLFVIKYYLL